MDIKPKKKNEGKLKLVFQVSLFWVGLAIVAFALVKYGQMQYNKGVYEGLGCRQTVTQK